LARRRFNGLVEERLLRAHFGAECEAYCARTRLLLPSIY
jgi:protein-S-isoprenylcysteine O-methyltransferase Ste14